MSWPVDEHGKEFAFLKKVEEPDGQGGTIVTWGNGERFLGVLEMISNTESRIASGQDIPYSAYSITVNKDVAPNIGDIFIRLDDNVTFRITSPDEQQSPDDFTLQIKKFEVDGYDIPADLSLLDEHGIRFDWKMDHLNIPVDEGSDA